MAFRSHSRTGVAPGVEVLPSLCGGEGLYATRTFSPGNLVLEDTPLARVERMNDDCMESMGGLYEGLIASGKRDGLVGHTDIYRGPPDGPRSKKYREWADQLFDSVQERDDASNSMLAFAFNAYSSTPGGTYELLYKLFSKANHSCSPNVSVHAPLNGTGQLVCMRPIAIGDEIYVSYLDDADLLRTALSRKKLLFNSWEFECSCARCKELTDDVRRFGCPLDGSGCHGRCFALRSALGLFLVAPCDDCRAIPSEALCAEWGVAEAEMEACEDGLLDLAWAHREAFAVSHPEHWLSCCWDAQAASVAESKVDKAGTPEEAEKHRVEAVAHRRAAKRCGQYVLAGHSDGGNLVIVANRFQFLESDDDDD